jgi:hypothetical protein
MESKGIVDAIFRPVKIILEKNFSAVCRKICYNKYKKRAF